MESIGKAVKAKMKENKHLTNSLIAWKQHEEANNIFCYTVVVFVLQEDKEDFVYHSQNGFQWMILH